MNCVRFGGVLIRFIMKINLPLKLFAGAIAGALFSTGVIVNADDYQVFVSNEKAGTEIGRAHV